MDARVSRAAPSLRSLAVVSLAMSLTCAALYLLGIQGLAYYGLRRWPVFATRVAWLLPTFLAVAMLCSRTLRKRRTTALTAFLRGTVLGLFAGAASLATAQLLEPSAVERLNNALRADWVGFAAVHGLMTFATLGWLYGLLAALIELALDRRMAAVGKSRSGGG